MIPPPLLSLIQSDHGAYWFTFNCAAGKWISVMTNSGAWIGSIGENGKPESGEGPKFKTIKEAGDWFMGKVKK